MCGIFGYIGPKDAVKNVVDGLKRLEYRGYDSAGVCFKDKDGVLSLYKKTGKVQNLESLLKGIETESHSCIGHTRWATHGEVNDVNAHPHLSDTISVSDEKSIAIVHNGIIENAAGLRNELESNNFKFTTETDSEVFLGLMVRELLNGSDLMTSIDNSFKLVEGNSAFVIQVKGKDEIFAVKRGAPLVCGAKYDSSEYFVSSDPFALAGVVDKLYFPEDEVVCSLVPLFLKEKSESERIGLEFYELDGSSSKRYSLKEMDISTESADKGDFDHYMLKEIYEQPFLITNLANYYHEFEGSKLDFLKSVHPEQVHIIGCGTAWHAGLVIKNYIEKFNRVKCAVELASEFRYRDPILNNKDLGVFISQSGETADTLAAQTLCKANKLDTFSIVNVEGSTLFRESSENLLIKAGVEIGVASTKAFTLQALTGRVLSLALEGKEFDESMLKKFRLLSDRISSLLHDNEIENIKEISTAIYNKKGFIFTGRGQDYPIALEGALKLKEIAYVHAEGYAAGELKHGPIALIDEEMVNVAIVSSKLVDKTVSNIQEVKARKGIIVIAGPESNKELIDLADYYIPLKYDELDELEPLYINVAMQLLAYYMAKFKGTDIDKPRNLAKSVTVE